MLRKSTFGFFLALLFVANGAGIANAQINLEPYYGEGDMGRPRVLTHDLRKRVSYTIVGYERKGERNWWREGATAYFAGEQLYYTRKTAERFGFSPEDAEKYVQFKRDLINEVSKRGGEEEWGIWRSPKGYTICRAEKLSQDFKFQAGPSDVTFNARVLRSRPDDGLGYYAVAPESWKGTRISATIGLTFLKVASTEDVNAVKQFLTNPQKCMFHNTCAWVCRNNNCSHLNVPNCEAKDGRKDRWLSGEGGRDDRWLRGEVAEILP
jgi:hypothetical protein